MEIVTHMIVAAVGAGVAYVIAKRRERRRLLRRWRYHADMIARESEAINDGLDRCETLDRKISERLRGTTGGAA